MSFRRLGSGQDRLKAVTTSARSDPLQQVGVGPDPLKRVTTNLGEAINPRCQG
jgi:hypothetical protein